MAHHDGNGWVDCRCGHRHWGLHGAAGLVLARPAQADPYARSNPVRILVQLRAAWTHQGGTWAIPGGARDSHEDPVAAALREAHEETGVDTSRITVVGQHPGVEHGDWSYIYVLARCDTRTSVSTRTDESDDLRWVTPDEVDRLELHPGFRSAWPALRQVLAATPPWG